MKQKHADGVAALVVGFTLLIGGFATWRAYQQWIALDEMGGHMGSVTAMHGTHPVWYFLGTILVAVVVSGVYLGVRDRIGSPSARSDEPSGDEHDADTAMQTEADDGEPAPTTESQPSRSVLELLPDDERRILQPVLESPGLTQIALRDKSNFSKSKVSQTVTDLEKRGLLYREPQGRTYRVYPSDELEQSKNQSSSPE